MILALPSSLSQAAAHAALPGAMGRLVSGLFSWCFGCFVYLPALGVEREESLDFLP